MDLIQIRTIYINILESKASSFIYEKMTNNTIYKAKEALQDAATRAYEHIPPIYRDMYQLLPPLIDIVKDSENSLLIVWLQGKP